MSYYSVGRILDDAASETMLHLAEGETQATGPGSQDSGFVPAPLPDAPVKVAVAQSGTVTTTTATQPSVWVDPTRTSEPTGTGYIRTATTTARTTTTTRPRIDTSGAASRFANEYLPPTKPPLELVKDGGGGTYESSMLGGVGIKTVAIVAGVGIVGFMLYKAFKK